MQRQPLRKAVLRAALYAGWSALMWWLAVTGIQSGSAPYYPRDIARADHPVWFWLIEILDCTFAGGFTYYFYRHLRWLFGRPEAREKLDDLDPFEIERAELGLHDVRPLPFAQTGAVGSYVGGNPWQNGRTDRFTIEVYHRSLLPQGSAADQRQRNPSPGQLLLDDQLRIRFDHGNKSHRLPNSLDSLWRSGQVSTEALPQLLHDLQPQLRESDYMPMLQVVSYKWLGVIIAVPFLALAATALILIPPGAIGIGPLSARLLGAITFFLMGLGFLLGFAAYTRRLRRRRRDQARWIIAANARYIAPVHAPDAPAI
jgi:hypothetical protein